MTIAQDGIAHGFPPLTASAFVSLKLALAPENLMKLSRLGAPVVL
jgi:hypothetical protein